VAFSQFLLGHASSQVGIGIGLIRSVLAFIGFTLLPVLVGYWLTSGEIDTSFLNGLKLVALAIVAQAGVEMWQKSIVKLWNLGIALRTIVLLLMLSSI